MNQASYTAANQYPVKIIQNPKILHDIREYRIPPIHPQFMPTNRCNLNCDFCSCSARNRHAEMKLTTAIDMLYAFSDLGALSMTITGGGDPLMWPHLEEFMSLVRKLNIEIGLVTNGLAIGKLSQESLSHLTWCRLSCSDKASRLDVWREVIARNHVVNWAMSYVLTREPNLDNLADHIEFANALEMTHVRIVSDLLDVGAVMPMSEVKTALAGRVDDSRVIYQGRKEYVRGCEDCRIGLLKPVIGPDGKIYPCCGVQYAHEPGDLDLPESMCVGHVSEIPQIWAEQRAFDGRQCVKCYYSEYNHLIRAAQMDVVHGAFI